MSISDIFHYPFYMHLINNFEKPDNKLVVSLNERSKTDEIAAIPSTLLEKLESEVLLSLSLTCSNYYISVMRELKNRIKPLADKHSEKISQMNMFMELNSSIEQMANSYVPLNLAILGAEIFSRSAPIPGLVDPELAFLAYKRRHAQIAFPGEVNLRNAIEAMIKDDRIANNKVNDLYYTVPISHYWPERIKFGLS